MIPPQTRNAGLFRDIPVDLLRGLAIAIMIAANLIPFLLAPPVPFWLRLLASVAAPLFIFLSGMMVALSFRKKRHNLSYFVLRGGAVVLLGALLDLLVRGMFPFMDSDVLYLIGISLPLTYLFLHLGFSQRVIIILSVVAAAPLLQGFIGYGGLPLQVPLAPESAGTVLPAFPAILRQWLVDGWFPVFPWLAIALLGAQAGSFRWQENATRSFADRNIALVAGAGLLTGAVSWCLMPGAALTPFGYAELFYPPTTGFLFFITGIILCLFIIADTMVTTGFVPVCLQLPGQCPLAIYVIHTFIIEQFIRPLQLQVLLPEFLAGYLVFFAVMVGTAYGIRYLRLRVGRAPFMIRILIGG